MSITLKKPYLASLTEALNREFEKEGLPTIESPQETRTHYERVQDGTLEWIHPLFGSFEVKVVGAQIVDLNSKGPNLWTRIRFDDKPQLTTLEFFSKIEFDVRIFRAVGPKIEEVRPGNIPALQIPTTWSTRAFDQIQVPLTREKDVDNVDIIFLRPNGMLVQLQISLTTKNGVFWLAIQELYNGQVVRTTRQKAEELPTRSVPVGSHSGLVVPLYSEDAHGVADYFNAFSGAGNMIKRAIELNAVVQLSECVTAVWKPRYPELPEKMVQNGWSVACVAWFNLVLGVGIVVFEDGRKCFVHFKNILNENSTPIYKRDKNPVLEQMTPVAVKYQEGHRGPQATAVRMLE